MPCSACTTARSPASSASRTCTSSPSRPVNPGFRAGTFHTRGMRPRQPRPDPPSLPAAPAVLARETPACSAGPPRPGHRLQQHPPRLLLGHPEHVAVHQRPQHRRHLVAAPPPPAPAPACPAPCPARAPAAADHSSVVYRDRSKYAAENSATTRSHRSSASLIAVTKFRPAAQSHTSSSTRVPGLLAARPPTPPTPGPHPHD